MGYTHARAVVSSKTRKDEGRSPAGWRMPPHPSSAEPLIAGVNSVAETSNPPGVRPSCCFTPMAKSPNPEPVAAVQVVIVVRRGEPQLYLRGDTETQ
jgi:hypothetical protein